MTRHLSTDQSQSCIYYELFPPHSRGGVNDGIDDVIDIRHVKVGLEYGVTSIGGIIKDGHGFEHGVSEDIHKCEILPPKPPLFFL